MKRISKEIIEKLEEETPFFRRKVLSSIIYPEFFPLKTEDKVINLGCGIGCQAVAYRGQFGKMVGIDLDPGRVAKSMMVSETYGLKNYSALAASVEAVPLSDGSFDKVIAIDIIEHALDPKKMCLETKRLLKNQGQFLVTFPVMYDKYTRLFSRIGRLIFKKKKSTKEVALGDKHNSEHALKEWIELVESCGFRLIKSRATSLIPPFYMYGVKPFWFGDNIFHTIDNFLCQLPVLKNWGTASLCIFEKN